MKTLTIGLILIAASVAGAQELTSADGRAWTKATLVTCESQNNVRHTCKVDARDRMVALNQQLSDNACILGRTWGVNRDRKSVWVDRGCRAEFVVGASPVERRAFGRNVVCESQNNGKTNCAADTSYGVQLAKQRSRNDCVRGKDWGFDEGGIWVDHGCRAEFALGGDRRYAPTTSSTPRTITCESQDGNLNRCAADTYYGVTLARQISKSACMRGDSWGYDANGIWVRNGCRAEFVLGQ